MAWLYHATKAGNWAREKKCIYAIGLHESVLRNFMRKGFIAKWASYRDELISRLNRIQINSNEFDCPNATKHWLDTYEEASGITSVAVHKPIPNISKVFQMVVICTVY